MGFFNAFKRGMKAMSSDDGAGSYTLLGKKIDCPHCGKDQFIEGAAQLNTRMATFLDLDWVNKSATTLACANCGRIEWLMREPQRM
ncbi:MAG: hypothetical protein ACYTG7_09715 [Planctomycetota bacterium]|jgi:predicted nucleic-acid-binding Zn-ribbon protein